MEKEKEMARVTGLEPATSGVTGRHSNQLSYTRASFLPYVRMFRPVFRVARVTGLEPATSGVTGRHSNQLSYTRILEINRLANHPSRAACAVR
jgi:hypothetical protein